MNPKPHLRKSGFSTQDAWYCSLQRSSKGELIYWHEYGKTWQDAYTKMMDRLIRHGYTS